MIRVATDTLHFRDPETDIEDPEATFTIRKRLSHDAQMEYIEAAQDLDIDPDTGTITPRMATDFKLSRIQAILLKDALKRLEGIADEDGRPYTPDTFHAADAPLVRQVTDAIQERNNPRQKEEGPKE
jgi:hypothetical protein